MSIKRTSADYTNRERPEIGWHAQMEIDIAESAAATPEAIRKRLRATMTPDERRKYEQWIRDHNEILKSYEEAAK